MRIKSFITYSITFLLFAQFACGQVVYVDIDASGPTHDGSTWSKAYNHLQDALADANAGDEIWVAEGLYRPDRTSADPNGTGDRDATFQLKSSVIINGSYAGFSSVNSNVQDLDLYRSTLSGDLKGNDPDVNDAGQLINDPCRSENSYHIVTGSGVDSNAVLNSFVIDGGNADGSVWRSVGGGMLNDDGSPIVKNCIFTRNYSRPGVMFNYNNSNLVITNCVFYMNLIGWGGAITNTSSSVVMNNCLIVNNVGIEAEAGGVGLCEEEGSYSVVTNCTFSGNLCGSWYTAIHSSNSNPVITNCIIWPDDIHGPATISYSDIKTSYTGSGNINADPCFVNPAANDFHLKSQGGRWDVNTQSWVVDDITSPCIDAGNLADPIGLEPFSNGGIINMGGYGGTDQASKSYFDTAPCERIVAGDINGDCKVDFKDFSFIAYHWLDGVE